MQLAVLGVTLPSVQQQYSHQNTKRVKIAKRRMLKVVGKESVLELGGMASELMPVAR